MVLADLTLMSGVVLSTGGGAVLRPGNRERLRANGTVVYLHAEPTTLYGRIRHNRNRPLLRTTDQLARLAELYAVRDALYRETATFVVESERAEVMRLAHRFERLP
jgi:shikimate kinase